MICTKIFNIKHNGSSIRFQSTAKPPGYWNIKSNQRIFFDQLAVKLNIKQPEDWQFVSAKKVIQLGGWFVESDYNGSLSKGILLMTNCSDNSL
jgi:hypothetical protein